MPRLIACLSLLVMVAPPVRAFPSLAVMLDTLDAARPLDSDNLTLMASPKARAAVNAGDKAVRAGQPVAAAGHYARARGLVAKAGDAMADVLAKLDSNLVALYIDMRRGDTVVSMAKTMQKARSAASATAQVEAGRLLARALFANGQDGPGLEAARATMALAEAQDDWGAMHIQVLRCRLLLDVARLVAAREIRATNDILTTVDRLRETLGETSVEYVQLLPAKVLAEILMNRAEPAREALAAAIRGIEAAVGETTPLLSASLWLRADLAEASFVYREAVTDRIRVQALLTAAFGADHARALEAQVRVARLSFQRGLLGEAKALAEDAASSDTPSQAEASLLLAEVFLELDRPREAAKAATEARSRATRAAIRSGATAYLALAKARQGGPFNKPRAMAKEAVASLAKAHGERTIEVARLELLEASIEDAAGNHGAALRKIKDVAKLFPDTGLVQDRLAFLSARARARWREGKTENAENDLKELLTLTGPLRREAPLALSREKILSAEVGLALGDKDVAKERFALAKAAVARLPDGSLAANEFLAFQARVALTNEQWPAAESLAERWLAAAEVAGGDNDPRLAEGNLMLTDARIGQDRLEKALEAARRVQGMGRRTRDGLASAKKEAAKRVAFLTDALAKQGRFVGRPPQEGADGGEEGDEAPPPPENPFE
jgi:hypothetical protein